MSIKKKIIELLKKIKCKCNCNCEVEIIKNNDIANNEEHNINSPRQSPTQSPRPSPRPSPNVLHRPLPTIPNIYVAVV